MDKLSMYLVKSRRSNLRADFWEYHVVQSARNERDACDQVIMNTGTHKRHVTAQPIPAVFRLGQSNRKGIREPSPPEEEAHGV